MPAHPTDFPLLDDYNRANTGPPAGPIWSGLTFWGDSSGLLVTGNQMATSGSGYRCDYTTLSYPRSAPVGHRFAVPTAGTGIFIAWLLTNPSGPDGYGIRYDGSGSNELLRYSGGSQTWLGGWSQTWVDGDELCLIANEDDTVTAWHYSSGSWVKKVDVSDTTYTGSFHIGYTINDSSVRVDNTYGGNSGPPDPTPTVVSSSALVAASSGTTSTVTLPTHQADDILVVMAAYNSASNLSLSGSWNTILMENNANFSTALFWMRATGSGTTNPTVTTSTASSTNGRYAQAFVIRGCRTSGDPFEDATPNGSPTNTTTPATATIDTTDIDRLVMGFIFIDDDTAISSGWPPATYTEVANVSSTTGGDIRFLSMHKAQATADTVAGVTVATLSGAEYWKTVALAFVPLAVPGDEDISASDAGTWGETLLLGAAPESGESGTWGETGSSTPFVGGSDGAGGAEGAAGVWLTGVGETGTLGETAAALGEISPEDTGAGSEAILGIGVASVAEAGLGTEAHGSTAVLAGEDLGTPTEDTVTGITEVRTSSDAGTFSESPSEVEGNPSAEDTGSLGEGTPTVALSQGDEGSLGEDTAFEKNLSSSDHTGQGTEVAAHIAVTHSDSASSSETVQAFTGTPSGEDTGTGTDSATQPPVTITGEDSGAGTESVATAYSDLTDEEEGTATEEGTRGGSSSPDVYDAGVGSETAYQVAEYGASDLATATEGSELAVHHQGEDLGTGEDTSDASSPIVAAEEGLGLEATVLSGTLAEGDGSSSGSLETEEVWVSLLGGDTGSGTETSGLDDAHEPTAFDEGLGTDVGELSAFIISIEVATGASSLILGGALGGEDSGESVEGHTFSNPVLRGLSSLIREKPIPEARMTPRKRPRQIG